jgi:hypothetical protein
MVVCVPTVFVYIFRVYMFALKSVTVGEIRPKFSQPHGSVTALM